MYLTTAQNDRACGVILGSAVGDALGAGYEFGPALPDTADVSMKGGGPFGFAPSEWTDDTSMAIVIAEALAPLRRPILPADFEEHRRRFAIEHTVLVQAAPSVAAARVGRQAVPSPGRTGAGATAAAPAATAITPESSNGSAEPSRRHAPGPHCHRPQCLDRLQRHHSAGRHHR